MGSICEVARLVVPRVMALLVAAWLASCGGGGGGVGTGGTGTDPNSATVTDPNESTVAAAVVGPITGLGSIIVNGVRFETGSDIRSADEGIATSEAELRLGMMVEIQGSINAARSSGRASTVRWFSELRGAVSSVDAAARSFVVLGVPVSVSSSTVFSGLDALNSLRPGDVVEVYGLRDPTTNRLAATRIELESAPVGAAPIEYKLRATVSNLDAASRRFNLGAVLVTYAADTRIDPAPNGANLANGQMVTVYSNQAPGGGAWPAARVQVRSLAGRFEGASYGQVEGLVTGFASPSSFTVAGVNVDASRATFTRGSLADLRNGARIEADGGVESGRLIAARIKVERDDEDDDTERTVRGSITAFQSISNFTVRGETIDASQPGVQFERGSTAELIAGRTVRVEGRLRNAVLVASVVRFENGGADSIDQAGQPANAAATSQTGGSRGDSGSGQGQANGQAPASGQGLGQGQGNGQGQNNGQGQGGAQSPSGNPSGALQDLELRGVVTEFDAAGRFSVGGRRVDASAARIQPAQAALNNGSLVSVTGALDGDVLKASRVQVEDPEQGARIDARGVIMSFASTARFVVGGYTVDASRPSVRFDGGTAASLRNGRRVEVDGRLAGGIVVASRVRIED